MSPAAGGDRNALLSSIQKGKKLKKATTNDRSAPTIGDNNKSSASHSSAVGTNRDEPPSPRGGSNAGGNVSNGSAMGLGGLFAGGMPKLRSTGSNLMSSSTEMATKSSVPPQRYSADSIKEVTKPKMMATRPPPMPSAPKPTESSPVNPKPLNVFKTSASPEIRAAPTTTNSPIMNRESPGRAPSEPTLPSRPSLPTSGSPSTVQNTNSRPALPSRPAPLVPKMQNMKIADTINQSPRRTVEPLKPKSAVNTEIPFAKGGDNDNHPRANWQFPAESQIPRPTTHSGRVFVYPSGRDKGTFINEYADDGPRPTRNTTATKPFTATNTVINNHSTNNSSQSSSSTNKDLLQKKVKQLEEELDLAIKRQDFEVCLELKPRLTKLKDMLELSDRGLAIDKAKIDAV